MGWVSYFDILVLQGRFEILALTGSLIPSANGSQHDRLGGLSVSLSGPDGRVLGGGVAGPLIAASPVQVHFIFSHCLFIYSAICNKNKFTLFWSKKKFTLF